MKIYIHYDTTDQPWGGINSFLRSFKEYLLTYKKQEVEILESLQSDMDIFFYAAASAGPKEPIDMADIQKLRKSRGCVLNRLLKRKCYKLIHRLDGLRATYAGGFVENDELQIKLSQLADFTVFQSEESQKNFQRFGYNKDSYTIIYNGVNQTIFNTEQRSYYKEGKLKILSVSWSNNLKKGFQTIADFSENEHVESTFVGRWNDAIDRKNVRVIPPQKRETIVDYYKDAHVFLHAAQFDPCPNVLLEAMSCGLPVIYHNSGGTRELASSYGVPLPQVINSLSINAVVQQAKEGYKDFVDKLVKNKNNFSIERVSEQYLDTFKKVLSHNS